MQNRLGTNKQASKLGTDTLLGSLCKTQLVKHHSKFKNKKSGFYNLQNPQYAI